MHPKGNSNNITKSGTNIKQQSVNKVNTIPTQTPNTQQPQHPAIKTIINNATISHKNHKSASHHKTTQQANQQSVHKLKTTTLQIIKKHNNHK